jgi:gliding motility-associated-like protein
VVLPGWQAKVFASHIVGGEFELIHLRDSTYQINLNLYFDVINGIPGAADQDITAFIFSKGSNELIRSVTFNGFVRTNVEFFQPDCSDGTIETDKLFYSRVVTLEPSIFNDPQGYYIAWERCCRNYTITNIFSEPPNEEDPDAIFAGQTFYLEFPPVTKNGQPFVNSSPILFPPLSDYGCPNRLYWVDFRGFDPDGDSIVYSLTQPLSTFTGDAIVPPGTDPNPGPYPTVVWRTGFGPGNYVNGRPDLSISPDGLLTVTPTIEGLFVFSVKAEEFRNGEKIGEVRRDFQFFVTNCPPPGIKPELSARDPETGETVTDEITISFLADEEKCITFFIEDQNENETLQIRPRPINFFDDISEIFIENIGTTSEASDVLEFEACVSACPYVEGTAAIIDFVAYDGTCPLPLVDTLRVILDVEAPPNNAPFFQEQTRSEFISRLEGGIFEREFTGIDVDGDSMALIMVPEGFAPGQYGMEFNITKNSNGETVGRFFWDTNCQVYDFISRNTFDLRFILEDLDECDVQAVDVFNLSLEVELPPNTDPVISTSRDLRSVIPLQVGETINFTVEGLDRDNDEIELLATPLNFLEEEYPFQFNDTTGISSVRSDFSFTYSCELSGTSSRNLTIEFGLEDFDKCKETNRDQAFLVLELLPPENNQPEIRASENDLNFSLQPDDRLSIELFGNDIDSDLITLRLLSTEGFGEIAPFSFPEVSGFGSVTSVLEWDISCGDIRQSGVSNPYSLSFIVEDSACNSRLSDTLTINVVLEDEPLDFTQTKYPNIFTPNGDDKNPFFTIPNLPEGNCANEFQKFSIVNRWGREVFESFDRNFQWDGESEPTGVYYWNVHYTQQDISGWVHLIR